MKAAFSIARQPLISNACDRFIQPVNDRPRVTAASAIQMPVRQGRGRWSSGFWSAMPAQV